ncbi:MAG: PepSY domain-containing protein [Rubellimicrobium sp.]|nr:PepSY domain-containing protein [Rubellimicrobium sp.]
MAIALTLGGAGTALADDDCHVPMERWQAPAAIVEMAAERGWQITRLKIDDGCYEIRGVDAEGRAFEADLDPESLAVIDFEYRTGDDHDRDHDRPGAGQVSGQMPGQGGTPPANDLFGGGTAPTVTVN